MTSHSEVTALEAELAQVRAANVKLLDTVRWSHDFLTHTCGVASWPLVDRLYNTITEVTAPPVEEPAAR